MEKNETMRTMSMQELQETEGGGNWSLLINMIVDAIEGEFTIYV